MTQQERALILDCAKDAFFAALLDGYAGEERQHSTKTTSPDGYTKTITFNRGDYRVVDEYHVTPWSNFSAGTTMIYHQGIPVWWMTYGGFYKPKTISFLKKVLAKNYREGIFLGGRGPRFFLDPETNIVYINNLQDGNNGDFENFAGIEHIYDSRITGTNGLLGYHKYFGMSLI